MGMEIENRPELSLGCGLFRIQPQMGFMGAWLEQSPSLRAPKPGRNPHQLGR